jgi:hypothetical protein
MSKYFFGILGHDGRKEIHIAHSERKAKRLRSQVIMNCGFRIKAVSGITRIDNPMAPMFMGATIKRRMP